MLYGQKEIFTSFPELDNGTFNASFLSVNIPALIDNMKHDKSWKKGKLSSIILLNTPVKKVVLTLIPEGTEVTSFQSHDSATFQIIEGRLEFYFQKEYSSLNINELLTLNKKINYNYYSVEDTAFLLTLLSGNLLT
jgi:hypothetical protein